MTCSVRVHRMYLACEFKEEIRNANWVGDHVKFSVNGKEDVDRTDALSTEAVSSSENRKRRITTPSICRPENLIPESRFQKSILDKGTRHKPGRVLIEALSPNSTVNSAVIGDNHTYEIKIKENYETQGSKFRI